MTDPTLDVLFTPADFAGLKARDLTETVCVVFDVLRATSSIVTALANGASAVVPVAEISEALALRQRDPSILLAGERDGVRILGHLTGGVPFDLGNSPREFMRPTVADRTIAMTTTNGTRALRACARAWAILIGSFLNLRATAELLFEQPPRQLLLVCSGTYEHAAYEDVLAAGALCDLLHSSYKDVGDGAQVARRLFLSDKSDLLAALAARSRNAQRLLAHPQLSEDVRFCLQRDVFPLTAELSAEGLVRRKV